MSVMSNTKWYIKSIILYSTCTGCGSLPLHNVFIVLKDGKFASFLHTHVAERLPLRRVLQQGAVDTSTQLFGRIGQDKALYKSTWYG